MSTLNMSVAPAISKVKTIELEGAALDWAVATCEGYTNLHKIANRMPHEPQFAMMPRRKNYGAVELWELGYSTDWSQGGPIVEREGISVMLSFRDSYAEGANAKPSGWCARKYQYGVLNEPLSHGPTPLVAAMRCYVASKLGDEIELPEDMK